MKNFMKIEQQGSQLFQFWSLSLQSVKHHTSVLPKYKFYIKVDKKAYKVKSVLLCRIITWSSESSCEISFQVWDTWERGLLCRVMWESSLFMVWCIVHRVIKIFIGFYLEAKECCLLFCKPTLEKIYDGSFALSFDIENISVRSAHCSVSLLQFYLVLWVGRFWGWLRNFSDVNWKVKFISLVSEL